MVYVCVYLCVCAFLMLFLCFFFIIFFCVGGVVQFVLFLFVCHFDLPVCFLGGGRHEVDRMGSWRGSEKR